MGCSPRAKITIKVVDDDGKSVDKAKVAVYFDEKHNDKGSTDADGLFTASSVSRYSDARIAIAKDRYYESSYTYQFIPMRNDWGKWQPWNPVITSVVRRIINPIPMYAKHVETKIPRTNEWFGYDLVKADWVSPVGKGVVSDFMFRVDGYWKDYRNHDTVLSLNFQHDTDGLLPYTWTPSWDISHSELDIPHQAPENGYLPTYKFYKFRKDNIKTNDCEKSIAFRFRIHRSTDESGTLTYALYGKIRYLKFGGASEEPSYLQFTYYLNPTPNDRNLEFDPKKNLLKGLKSTAEVRAP